MITKVIAPIVLAVTGALFPFQVSQEKAEPTKVLEMKAPAYPAIAEAAHASGIVRISLDVDYDGSVAASRPVSGNPLLLAAARQAASSWRFEPTDQSRKRDVLLTFDFVPPYEAKRCSKDEAYELVSPYHLRIYSQFSLPPDTVSEIANESEPGVCPVHHTPLLKDKVEINYGLVYWKKGYLSAERKSFPYANTRGFGGCTIETVVDPCSGNTIQKSPKYEEVLYCEKCRTAKAKWLKNHQNTKYSWTG